MSENVFIIMALYPEAKPLIRRLALKKEEGFRAFAAYGKKDTGIHLVLTGSGQVAAAAAVGSCLAYYGVGPGDVLMNIGSCACLSHTVCCDADAGSCAGEYGRQTDMEADAFDGSYGEMYLIHKITDAISGHTFYPDIWYRHPLREAEIWTVPRVITGNRALTGERLCPCLCDMEAAAVYQAASYYLGPHQMCFLKIISDRGEGEAVSPESLTDIVGQNADDILGQLAWMRQENGGAYRDEPEQQYRASLESLAGELHCSRTMYAALEQCLRYWTLAGVDFQNELDRMRTEGVLPCRDKREGKQRFEELKRRLL